MPRKKAATALVDAPVAAPPVAAAADESPAGPPALAAAALPAEEVVVAAIVEAASEEAAVAPPVAADESPAVSPVLAEVALPRPAPRVRVLGEAGPAVPLTPWTAEYLHTLRAEMRAVVDEEQGDLEAELLAYRPPPAPALPRRVLAPPPEPLFAPVPTPVAGLPGWYAVTLPIAPAAPPPALVAPAPAFGGVAPPRPSWWPLVGVLGVALVVLVIGALVIRLGLQPTSAAPASGQRCCAAPANAAEAGGAAAAPPSVPAIPPTSAPQAAPALPAPATIAAAQTHPPTAEELGCGYVGCHAAARPACAAPVPLGWGKWDCVPQGGDPPRADPTPLIGVPVNDVTGIVGPGECLWTWIQTATGQQWGRYCP